MSGVYDEVVSKKRPRKGVAVPEFPANTRGANVSTIAQEGRSQRRRLWCIECMCIEVGRDVFSIATG